MRRFTLSAALMCTAVLLCAVGAQANTSFERPAGAEKELVGQRTPTSRTWALPNGQHVTQISASPEQWEDDSGQWHDLRPSLRHVRGRWSAATARTTVSLPERLGSNPGDVISLRGSRGDAVSMTLVGADSVGAVSGSRMTFEDIWPGASLAFDVVPSGLKETLDFQHRGAARDLVYRLTAASDGLVVREDGQGGALVMRGTGQVFEISKPAVYDGAQDVSLRARLEVRRLDDRSWELRTDLDEKWLDVPGRKWPVTVDPTIAEVNTFRSNAALDCESYYGNDAEPPAWQSSNFPEWHGCNQIDFRAVGHHPDGPWWFAGYQLLRFNALTFVQDDEISSAKLSLQRLSSVTPNNSAVGVYPLTADIETIVSQVGPARNRYHLERYDDQQRVAAIPPGPTGTVDADVTGVVTQWRRHTNTGGDSGLANRGLLLHHEDLVHRETDIASKAPRGASWCRVQACDQTLLASSTHPTPSFRPMLEVKSWPAAPSGSAVVSPTEGTLTGRWLKLQARAMHESVATARFQYIAGGGNVWRDIPLTALRELDRTALASQDVPMTGAGSDRRSRMVAWDVAGTPGGGIDGPVRVRAFFESPTLGHGGMTREVEARLDRKGVSGSARVELGPGSLDLTSGEFSMSMQDATFTGYLQDLNLTRTYSSRGVPKRNADMFGPGWEGNVEADGGDLPYKGIYNFTRIRRDVIERQRVTLRPWSWEAFWNSFDACAEIPECQWRDPEPPGYTVEALPTIQEWEYRYAVVELDDGTKLTFMQTVSPDRQVTGWEAQGDMARYTLQHASTATPGIFEFALTEPDGGVAKFTSEAVNSPNYRLRSFQQVASPTAMSYTYEASGKRQRLKRVTAPYPAGGRPRWMEFDWRELECGQGWPDGTPPGPGYPACDRWRVIGVRVGTGSEAGTIVASYGYTDRGILAWETDPRISPSLITAYGYDSRGMLTTISPPGEAPWALRYTRLASDDAPRLDSITRPHPDGGAAIETVRYDVPLSGANAPHDMSARQTARWDQVGNDIPWDAVAIFPADDVPAATNPNYRRATTYYIDADAQLVNVAEPGGHITTTGYDASGNDVRELTATNRTRALAAGANSARVAQDLSTVKQYSGGELVATYEPRTEIQLSNGTSVTGRRVASVHYDEGSPGGRQYGLPTSEWRAVDLGGGNQADIHEVVRYGYDGYAGMTGWAARAWTEKVVDPNGKRLYSYRLLHPTYPVVDESRTPGAGPGGGDRPDVRYYQYQDITPFRMPVALRGCFYYEPPSGFRCLDTDNMAPARRESRYYNYDGFGRPSGTSIWGDSSSYARRYIFNDYYADGHLSRRVMTDNGNDFFVTDYMRSPSTGRTTRVEQITYDQQARPLTQTVAREYDSNGNLKTYTDASATTTRYRYDLRGRTTETVENDSRTTRFAYDDRDQLISVSDPDIDGPITATYDPDGQLVSETLPQGLELTQAYDPAGRARSLRWTQTYGCWVNCLLVRDDILARGTDGRITQSETNDQRQTTTYDSVGRLAASDMRDLAADVCIRTSYEYDGGGSGDSNRTATTTRLSARSAACGTGAATTRAWQHNNADQITNAGWTFDGLGRTTTVPSPDSGGSGTLTASYFADDRIRQLTLDGRTHAYARDPLRRTKTITSSGAGKPDSQRIYRYADDTDQPVSIGSDRNILGPSGTLVALTNPGGIRYQLRDMAGSIVTTVPVTASGMLLGPDRSTRYDEFGKVLRATPGVVDWTNGAAGNGWLGAHQRMTQFEQREGSGPPVEMGARVYLPAVGRFLQRDPVDGGSANDYDYVNQDPLNDSDLTGTSAPTCRNMLGVFCDIQKWINDTLIETPRRAVGYLFKKCLAGVGWGTVLSIGSYLAKRVWDVRRIYDAMKLARADMQYYVFVPKGYRYRSAAGRYARARNTLYALGKTARVGTGIGVAVSCIDGAFGSPFD